MEGGWKTPPPPPVLHQPKKPGANRVKNIKRRSFIGFSFDQYGYLGSVLLLLIISRLKNLRIKVKDFLHAIA